MTPQSTFVIAAPIRTGREADLRALLVTMNRLPGFADPKNPLVPFGEFETLHFARFVILNDPTLSDLDVYGVSFPNAPLYLLFLGDCDGPADVLLADFAHRAGKGLRTIFGHCEGFDVTINLVDWMQGHSIKPAAHYIHGIGRSVRQIREEAAAHEALVKYLSGMSTDDAPQEIHRRLERAVREQGPRLTPEPPTPLAWRLRRFATLAAALIVVLVLLFPLTLSLGATLIVYAIVLAVVAAALGAFLVILRRHETSDPDILIPPTGEHLAELGAIQDHDITNQYTAFGAIKPGPFRRWTMSATLWAVNLATPLLYPRGNLARVKTIHFAHWVFFDDKRRLLFTSNYDGSAESYMDDFVNKVAFGLNLIFSHGLGYPRTRFLLRGGAEREQEFKNTQRRHALPTEVWYKAYPGLSLFDIERNARIRQGLERPTMTDAEIRQWLGEILTPELTCADHFFEREAPQPLAQGS